MHCGPGIIIILEFGSGGFWWKGKTKVPGKDLWEKRRETRITESVHYRVDHLLVRLSNKLLKLPAWTEGLSEPQRSKRCVQDSTVSWDFEVEESLKDMDHLPSTMSAILSVIVAFNLDEQNNLDWTDQMGTRLCGHVAKWPRGLAVTELRGYAATSIK